MTGDAPRRVIVCGGRDYTDEASVRTAMLRWLGAGSWTVVHGAQRGADHTAARVALSLGLGLEQHPADVARYGSPAAFHVRNQEMVDAGADLVLAFPGGSGTANLIERAQRVGIPVVRWSRTHEDPAGGGRAFALRAEGGGRLEAYRNAP